MWSLATITAVTCCVVNLMCYNIGLVIVIFGEIWLPKQEKNTALVAYI